MALALRPFWLTVLEQKVVTQHQNIHFRSHEAAVSIVRCADDRLTTHVKRGIHDYLVPCPLFKSLDKIVVRCVILLQNGLDARRIVHMRNGWEVTPRGSNDWQHIGAVAAFKRKTSVRFYWGDQQHVWTFTVEFEVV